MRVRHHIVPSSRGGSNNLENIARVNQREHNLYHSLFENKTPEEIGEYLNREFWKQNYTVLIKKVDKRYT